MVVVMVSCQKDSKPVIPSISFKKGLGYTSIDDTIAKGSVLKIGIIASKAEKTEVLTKLTKMVTYDNTIDSPATVIPILTNSIDSFSQDYTISTRNIPGTEKYVFTIYDQSGTSNSVKLTIRTE